MRFGQGTDFKMKVIFDTGDIIDEAVGIVFEKSTFHRATSISVDRSEISFFTAKGGIWNNYANYLRENILKSKAQQIYINDTK